MSLVGFKAKNHQQQTKKRGADDGVDERITPDEIFVPLNEIHRFSLDVAANSENTKCIKFFDRAADGLKQSWAGETVWCNPPYSDLSSWVEKAFREVTTNKCKAVVMLLPANRTEQGFWQKWIEPNRDRPPAWGGDFFVSTTFLGKRRRFGWPKGRVVPKKGDRPPFGLVVVTFEPSPFLLTA